MTYYNEYNEIPLFIGNISKQIYDKVMKLNHKLTAYKGWNGVDSYAKFSSSDPNKYEYQYVDGVKKEVPIIHSTKYSDKVKASVNKKRNNVGNYDRFHHKKLLINEVMFNSFEVTNHIKYFIKDELGEYGSSPKHTVIVFDDENMDSYINDSNVELTQEEETFVNLFNETPNDKIYSLEGG